MAAEAKALLDELMGRARNLDPSQHPQDITWDNPDVCKHFLCGFCPHELFTNTRADLGPCNKMHDEALRKEYQQSSKFEKCGYEEDFIRFLQTLISDVEKRIKRGHQRLALSGQQNAVNGSPGNQNEEKIKLLTEKINSLVQQAEELGCEGKVEEAQGVMKLAEQLREERLQLETPTQDDVPMMKQMEVCEVCGAFLIVGDAPQRQDEHLMGKQHAGFAQVRSEVERRKQKAREELEAREANEARLKLEREEREKERIREKDQRRQKEREREKEKERERERRRRSRSRSRDRRRSRSRDRQRRRSSSRDRDRDRDRRRSQRSRSRDRRRRSRSSSTSRRYSRRSSSRDRKSNRRRSRDRRSRSHNRSKSRDRKSKSNDKGNKGSETEKKKIEKDKAGDGKSKKEVQDSATNHEGRKDSFDVTDNGHINCADDNTTEKKEDISGGEKNVQDNWKMSAVGDGLDNTSFVNDGGNHCEGDSKIDE